MTSALPAPDNLACPLCSQHLRKDQQRLVCGNNHSFDIARQGYVNLLPVQHKKSREPGDSKAMVQARRSFLNHGCYQPLADKLVELACTIHQTPAPAATTETHPCILDAGCGEGYYLEHLTRELLSQPKPWDKLAAIGLDISRDAITAAARRDRSISWIVGTNVHPPVLPGTVDVLLCLFGFPSFKHFQPLLRQSGVIILADSGPDHLLELRELIYPVVRRSPVPELAAANAEGLHLQGTETVRYQIDLEKNQLQNLLTMTPHLYKASHEGKAAVARLERLTVTVEVIFRVLGRG